MISGIFDGQKIGVAFCTPVPKVRLRNGEEILDTITYEWHRKRTALALGTNINFMELHEDGKEVGDARTSAAYRCLEHQPQPKYLFFLDYDVLPDFDAFTKLFFRLQTMPDHDIATGVYCCKWMNPADPLIYTTQGEGAFWDWSIGDILTTDAHGIRGTHMGLTLIRVSLFQRLLDAGIVNDDIPFFQTIRESERNKTRSGTEDLFFYQLLDKLAPRPKIVVDTSVLAGHIDKNQGRTWGLPADCPPVKRAKWLTGEDQNTQTVACTCRKKKRKSCPECKGTGERVLTKLALDIGAGETRRQWPAHRTYTLDIRPETKPDYCQDSRWMNLPSDHFDLLASSHHFEHIGRWDQEQLWSEVFRVCKPGGRIEIIVPSVEWAAAKIADGQGDGPAFDVLYGAQEAHGYERQYNTHYFGYTKDNATALAEQAGFMNVKCEDWRDNARLGYNLIITGQKPVPRNVKVKPSKNGKHRSGKKSKA